MYRPAVNEIVGGSSGAAGSGGTGATPVYTQYVSLDSTYKDPSSSNYAPIYNFPAPISCAQDEYMTLTLQRANLYHDWPDIPSGAQITFTKAGQSPYTVSLAKYGKPLYGNLATLIYNAYHTSSGDNGFNIVYDSTTGGFVLTFSVATTMTFPATTGDDLARYMGYEPQASITSVANTIKTPILRPQKTLNMGVLLNSVNALRPSFVAGQYRTTLCIYPILSNPYVLAAYRSYVENEMAVRIREKSISALALQFIDTATGLTVPVKESHLTVQINIYKI